MRVRVRASVRPCVRGIVCVCGEGDARLRCAAGIRHRAALAFNPALSGDSAVCQSESVSLPLGRTGPMPEKRGEEVENK